jgi:CheY-like chemotaxis protein
MKRILLIEDDLDLSRSILFGIDLLNIPDLETEIKLDGAEALARISAAPAPDLVILDMHLPHVAGQDIYIAIRKEIPDCRIIIMTANMALVREINRRQGDWQILPAPDDVFSKPFSLMEFQQSVGKILGVTV